MAKLFNESILETYYGGLEFPGSVQIFSNCAKLMLENLPHRLQSLEDAIMEQNFEKVLFHAHQLKGSFGATGSDLLAEFCASMEEHARRKEALELQQALSNFEPLVTEFKQQLHKFLIKIGQP